MAPAVIQFCLQDFKFLHLVLRWLALEMLAWVKVDVAGA